MIELTQPTGQAVFINPAHVVAVLPGPGKQSEVFTSSGGVFTVLDSVRTIVDMVRNWHDHQMGRDL